MVSGTLNVHADSPRGLKCRIAASCSGADVNVVEVHPNDKNHQHVPNFVSTDKKVKLFDHNAIAFYLACEQGRGSSVEERAQIIQWVSYSNGEVFSAVASWVYPAISLVESTPELVQRAKNDLKRCFGFIDQHLKTRTFLATERPSIADVTLATDLLLAFQHVADADFCKPFVNLNRWFQTIINQPPVKKVLGQITLCTKTAEFSATKFAENKKAREAKPKADKPKPEKKKEEKKKPEPEEEDEMAVEEPRQNDPFAALPKGTFVMDEFKRTYSNMDTEKVAIPYFFDNFDKECYSVWFCEYKYADELTLAFMSSNLIGGMFQRIEKLRKNAFGSMIVWGENNNNTIAGVWVWKGHELAFPLCKDWTVDYESYDWRKMNVDDEKDKALIKTFFMWEGEYNGKKYNAGKIFK